MLLAALMVRSTIDQLRGDLEMAGAEIQRLGAAQAGTEPANVGLEAAIDSLQRAFTQFETVAEASLKVLDVGACKSGSPAGT